MTKQGEEFQKGTDTDITNGPVKKRGCTDILCLLLFIIHWAAAVWVCIQGFNTGNPNRLIAGQDFEGSFCGVTDPTNLNEKKDFKYLLYTLNPDLAFSSLDNATSTIAAQRALFASTLTVDNFFDTFVPVCVSECPCSLSTCPSDNKLTQTVSITKNSVTQSYSALDPSVCPYSDQTKCIPANYDAKGLLNRYCIPQIIDAQGVETALSEFVPTEVTGSWATWIGDIASAWWTFIVAFGYAVVIGFLFLLLMRYTSSLLIWVLILGAFVGLIVGGVALKSYASGLDESRTSDKQGLEYFAYAIWAIAALYFLIMLCQCKNIRIGVGIVKTASMFMYNTGSILFVPLIFWALTIALYVWFVFGTVYILSSAERNDSTSRFSWSSKTQYLFIYHFFSLLWNNAFLIGLSQVVIAGAVGTWYFTVPNENGKKKSSGGCLCLSGSISQSFYNAIRYHLGSIAFGSLILAIVQLIKYMLMYLANQAKQADANPSQACNGCLPCGLGKCFSGFSGANRVVVILLTCCAYLVACFEKCIKFINKNAYIQIALLGKNFCKSAYNAFSLVVRNPGRFIIANGIAGLISFVGKLAIAGLTGLFGFLTCTNAIDDLSSPWAPTVLFVIIGYVVGSFFMDVFDMAVDATLQCFLADEELTGSGGTFTPEPLQAFINRK